VRADTQARAEVASRAVQARRRRVKGALRMGFPSAG